VLLFIAGSKFQPVCNFTELHALTQATHSYALLLWPITYAIQSLFVVDDDSYYKRWAILVIWE